VACLGDDEQRKPRRKEERIRTGYAGSQSRKGGRRGQALAGGAIQIGKKTAPTRKRRAA
jgi:hypothetical protein